MSAVPTTPLPTGIPADQILVVPTGWDPRTGKFQPYFAQPTAYQTVAAGQTAAVLGPTGAVGDLIGGVLIIPALVACGVVTLLDGATSLSLFVGGGTTALVDTKPFWVPLGLISVSGPWKITTGVSVSVIAAGRFTA